MTPPFVEGESWSIVARRGERGVAGDEVSDFLARRRGEDAKGQRRAIELGRTSCAGAERGVECGRIAASATSSST
jgi:hypothetical protein